LKREVSSIRDLELLLRIESESSRVSGVARAFHLAIVKEIMNSHRGRISVDAGPNGGAIFTLYFPLCPKMSHDLHKSAA
jgi:K+-sensing histidine kinase KdpD